MRVAIIAAIFALLGIFVAQKSEATHFYGADHTPSIGELISKPNKYLGETLREGIKPYDFWKAASKINTFFGFESLFKTEAIHNPFVWRQGGSFTPTPTPRGRPIPGIPFDVHTGTSAVIPGCLHRLCPAPQAALWYNGICWCSP
jgi:hypothetical protein